MIPERPRLDFSPERRTYTVPDWVLEQEPDQDHIDVARHIAKFWDDDAPCHRQCPHGFHHPPGPHSCDGCWCEGESDRRNYGWNHNTDPRETR